MSEIQSVMEIDFKKPYGKCRTMKPGTQKVFFVQGGIEYGSDGKACNPKQVKAYYESAAKEAQKLADKAKEEAAKAQEQVDSLLKAAGAKKD